MQGHSEILQSTGLQRVSREFWSAEAPLTGLEAIVLHLCQGVVCSVGCQLGRRRIAIVIISYGISF